jgi:hypothetical protein
MILAYEKRIKPDGEQYMEKRTQPLVSKEMIYVDLALVGFIIALLVQGSIEYGFVEFFQLLIGGLQTLTLRW